MKKLLVAALCLYTALFLTACTAAEDEEKGAIEEFRDEVARDATETLHKPLNKARCVKDIARQRNEALVLEEESEEEEW